MIMKQKYFRISLCTPKIYVGCPSKNVEEIKKAIKQVSNLSPSPELIVFPELSITGYTCGDMFLSDDLQNETLKAIDNLRYWIDFENITANILVGAPLQTTNGSLMNCAILLNNQEFGGVDCKMVIPKKNLPNYLEFYEKRWFVEGADYPLMNPDYSILNGGVVNINGTMVGVEICEDLWVPNSPCISQVINDSAEIIVNLSASPDLAGKSSYLKELIKTTSAKLMCGYAYTSSSAWESTTDLVFSGNQVIAENGVIIEESIGQDSLTDECKITTTDIDLEEIRGYRRKHKMIQGNSSFYTSGENSREDNYSYVSSLRKYNPYPFLDQVNYNTVFKIQSLGLQRRIKALGDCKSVIGISGGTDSTLALLVVVDAYKSLGLPLTNIVGITMPCFGTTSKTKNNSLKLMNLLGITSKEISIKDSVTEHLKELGHALDSYDTAYENAQARLRTVTLFNYSNMIGNALVIGTGDLSELALGWCTYGADHLSSYNVNVSIPKTLVKALIKWYAENKVNRDDELKQTLLDILGTPISPELLPTKDDQIVQVSEDSVGPYELHDFFLYHFLRVGKSAKSILYECEQAFNGKYDLNTIKEWEIRFFKRFASQQYKRSCLPDGPKTGSCSLSPRGDWRMPSDFDIESYLEGLKEDE